MPGASLHAAPGFAGAHEGDPPWDVVHIITRLELGGAQLATLHEVAYSRFPTGRRYLFFGPGGLLDGTAAELPGVVAEPVAALERMVRPLADLRAAVELTRALRRLRRSGGGNRLVVHTHSSKAGIVGRWAAFVAGADCIVHSIHGFGHAHHGQRWTRPVFLWAERLTARITDGFTADSAANITEGRRDGIIRRQPTQVVHCGIDVDAFRTPSHAAPDVRRELGIPAEHVVALSLACLKPQKDPLTYVEVARRCLAEQPAMTFLLAGDGMMRSAVEQAARDLGDRFRLLGWRRDAADLLHASDLLVLTSRWEGLPQVFAQAMAAARPIVATRVDGAPEAIVPGDNGLLFDVGDRQGMAAGIVALARDPERRRRMGERGRERVAPFSQQRMLDDLDAFYARLTGSVATVAAAVRDAGVGR